MTRGEMLDAVREEVGDTDAVAYTRVRCENALNRSARKVYRDARKFGVVRNEGTAATLTGNGTTTAFSLSANNVKVIDVVEIDSNGDELAPAHQIQMLERFQRATWDGNAQAWNYWLTRAPATGNITVNFRIAPSSGVRFRVQHEADEIAAIATGSGANDLLSYTAIPTAFHELVVAEAVLLLAGPDSTAGTSAAARYSMLWRSAVLEAQDQDGPREVIRDG